LAGCSVIHPLDASQIPCVLNEPIAASFRSSIKKHGFRPTDIVFRRSEFAIDVESICIDAGSNLAKGYDWDSSVNHLVGCDEVIVELRPGAELFMPDVGFVALVIRIA
jgi:hypothetical protein